MIRLFTALACAFTLAQMANVANAAANNTPARMKARELASLRQQDPNLPGTRAYAVNKIKTSSDCPLNRSGTGRDDSTTANSFGGKSPTNSYNSGNIAR